MVCREWRLDNEHSYLHENGKIMEARFNSTDRELLRLKQESSRQICDLEITLRDSKTEVCIIWSPLSSYYNSICANSVSDWSCRLHR